MMMGLKRRNDVPFICETSSDEFDALWIRLDTISQRDRRTDRSPIPISRVSMLTRDKKISNWEFQCRDRLHDGRLGRSRGP